MEGAARERAEAASKEAGAKEQAEERERMAKREAYFNRGELERNRKEKARRRVRGKRTVPTLWELRPPEVAYLHLDYHYKSRADAQVIQDHIMSEYQRTIARNQALATWRANISGPEMALSAEEVEEAMAQYAETYDAEMEAKRQAEADRVSAELRAAEQADAERAAMEAEMAHQQMAADVLGRVDFLVDTVAEGGGADTVDEAKDIIYRNALEIRRKKREAEARPRASLGSN